MYIYSIKHSALAYLSSQLYAAVHIEAELVHQGRRGVAEVGVPQTELNSERIITHVSVDVYVSNINMCISVYNRCQHVL